jgi:hypothetical protein
MVGAQKEAFGNPLPQSAHRFFGGKPMRGDNRRPIAQPDSGRDCVKAWHDQERQHRIVALSAI